MHCSGKQIGEKCTFMQWLEKSSGFTQVQGLGSFKSTLTRLYATHHSFSLPEPRQIKPRALGVILSTSKSRRLGCCNSGDVLDQKATLSTSADVCFSTTFGSTFSVSWLGWSWGESRAVVQVGRRPRDRCAWSGWQCLFQRSAFPQSCSYILRTKHCRWPLPKHHSASRTFSWRLRLCSLEKNATLLQHCGARCSSAKATVAVVSRHEVSPPLARQCGSQEKQRVQENGSNLQVLLNKVRKLGCKSSLKRQTHGRLEGDR